MSRHSKNDPRRHLQPMALWLYCAIMLSACSTGLPRGPGEAASSIAIDDSRLDLAPHLGLALERMDWRLVPYESGEVSGASASLAEKARYRLEQTSTRIRACTAASELYVYEMRVVDNASGDVMLEFAGTDCEQAAGERLERYMRREGLLPP